MLYWIWSVILLLVGSVLVYQGGRHCRADLPVVGIGLLMAAPFFVADQTLVPAYRWLCGKLPSQGESINFFTAGVLVYGVVAIGIIFSCAALETLGEKKRKVAQMLGSEM